MEVGTGEQRNGRIEQITKLYMNRETNKKPDIGEWKTLPMELMGHFKDAYEWCLMERIWFFSNLDGHEINLTILTESTPIKRRETVLDKLNSLVLKRFINKTAFGKSGKHHIYSLNKTNFIEWAKEVLKRTSESPVKDQKKSLNGPVKVLNRTRTSPKTDCTVNLDNSPDNIKDNLPDNENFGKLSEINKQRITIEIEALKRLAIEKNFPKEYVDTQINELVKNYER